MPALFDSSFGAIGEFKESMLTEAQFQARYGTGWILADGRSVAGSRYAAITGSGTVPDARGFFRRGKNNSRADGNQDPAGERALGNFQNDQMQGHFHQIVGEFTDGAGGGGVPRFGGATPRDVGVSAPRSDGVNGTPRTGSETRVKNIAVNIFVRIN